MRVSEAADFLGIKVVVYANGKVYETNDELDNYYEQEVKGNE
jgi:hypothetical protein